MKWPASFSIPPGDENSVSLEITGKSKSSWLTEVIYAENTCLGQKCLCLVRCWTYRVICITAMVTIFRLVAYINGLLTENINACMSEHKLIYIYHQAIRRTWKCVKHYVRWMTTVRTMSGGENQRKRWHGNAWDCHEIELKALEWKRKWAYRVSENNGF